MVFPKVILIGTIRNHYKHNEELKSLGIGHNLNTVSLSVVVTVNLVSPNSDIFLYYKEYTYIIIKKT